MWVCWCVKCVQYNVQVCVASAPLLNRPLSFMKQVNRFYGDPPASQLQRALLSDHILTSQHTKTSRFFTRHHSHPNLWHLFSIHPRSTSLFSWAEPLFCVFVTFFILQSHSLPFWLPSVCVGSLVLLIKSNEVIYQGLLFSQHRNINHSP